MSRRIVVDSNRIFSELIATNQRLRQAFAAGPDTEFYCPKYVVVELFKHKERIAAATGLEESGLLALLYTLLSRIRFSTKTPSASGVGRRHGVFVATWTKTMLPTSRSRSNWTAISGPATGNWR